MAALDAVCGKAALERVDSSPELAILHRELETMTQRLPRPERYLHPAWAAFNRASRSHFWEDSHDAALAADKATRAAAERKRRATARKVRKKRRTGPQAMLAAIIAERARRAAVLQSLRTKAGVPTYVARLPPHSCDRTANVWAVRELLWRTGTRVTGRAIAEHLMREGGGGRNSIAGLTTRVIEALRRIDRLESEGVWTPFNAAPPRASANAALPTGAVWQMLDD